MIVNCDFLSDNFDFISELWIIHSIFNFVITIAYHVTLNTIIIIII